MSEQEAEGNQQDQVDERTKQIVNYVAATVGSLVQRKASGRIMFDIRIEKGKIPEKGCKRILDEDV